MKRLLSIKLLVTLTLLIVILSTLLLVSGCTGKTPGAAATELAATMVPPVDLDVYIFARQEVPTLVPDSLTGATRDISVQSLAIWGVVNSDTQYTIAGALTFTSGGDANAAFTLMGSSQDVYTKLSDRSIYFLQGSGSSAEIIKNAIDTNNFKQYNDQDALEELSNLPAGQNTIPSIIAVVEPTALNLIKKYLDQNTADTISKVFSSAKPRIITLGVYSMQPLNLSDVVQGASENSIWNMDSGVVVSMDSVYPGFIFSPIASHVISNEGFAKVKVGDLTAYRDSVNVGNGKTIPMYLNISGNHVYAVVSGNDTYAQTLLTSIKR